MQLQYTDVKNIHVVEDPAIVNQMIEKGWKLLTIESSSDEGTTYPLYILGWVHDVSQAIYEKQLAVANS